MPQSVTWDLVQQAIEVGCDVSTFLQVLDVDFDMPDITREQARSIIRYAKSQMELEQTVNAPSCTDVLSRKIDKMMEMEIDRLQEENEVLTKISKMPTNKKFMVEQTGEIINADNARARLQENIKTIMAMRKQFTEEAKAKESDGRNTFNMTVDLGSMVSSALSNIKDNAIDTAIDMVE